MKFRNSFRAVEQEMQIDFPMPVLCIRPLSGRHSGRTE